MSRLARHVGTAAGWLARIAEILASLAFGGVVAAFAYGVVMRYVVSRPSDWAGEIAIVLFLWVIMIGAGLAVPIRDHIAVDLVTARVPGGRWIEAGGALVAAAILLWALPTTVDYVLFLWREKTPALQLRLDVVYSCFAIFQAAVGVGLLAHAARVARGTEPLATHEGGVS